MVTSECQQHDPRSQPSPAARAHGLAPDSALTNAALAAAAGQGPLSLSHRKRHPPGGTGALTEPQATKHEPGSAPHTALPDAPKGRSLGKSHLQETAPRTEATDCSCLHAGPPSSDKPDSCAPKRMTSHDAARLQQRRFQALAAFKHGHGPDSPRPSGSPPAGCGEAASSAHHSAERAPPLPTAALPPKSPLR